MHDAASGRLGVGGFARRLARFAREAVKRTYALGVIALVTWLSYRAFAYLVVTLLFPSAVPAQITGIPTRLDDSVLETRRSSWLGMRLSENPRTPLAHYHRIDGWIQPDPFNDCTRSGCHAPLPHAARKEVRAFLNLHATSLHCGVCHMKSEDRPLVTTWYDLNTGKPRSVPTVLQTYAWLVSDGGRKELADPTQGQQEKLVALLRAAALEADNDPQLEQLAQHFAAVRYSSPAFQQRLERARETLPRHFRGEYGGKLALFDRQRNEPVLGHPGTAQAVAAYLQAAQTADITQKTQLLAAVHPLRRAQALHCAECHRSTGSLIDFAAAGYPPARVETLSRPVIFRMIQNIAEGQPFYLPGFVPPAGQPEELPAREPRRP